MKKILALICCLACVFCLSSCTYTKRGLENYSRESSPYRLGVVVSTDLVKSLPYVDGDYRYYDNHFFMFTYFEKFLLYLKYDDETYDSAKSETFRHNMNDVESAVPELAIGDYKFYRSGWEPLVEKSNAGEVFYMYFVVNDNEKILCFICLESSYGGYRRKTEKIVNLYETEGLKGIIDEYFIEWYDFYATNNA